MTLTDKSKFLAFLLRHKPQEANLILDKQGWCPIADITANTEITFEDLISIVDTDKKGRYSFDQPKQSSQAPTKIRANQGHSTDKVKLSFKTAVPPVVLYHGTSAEAAVQICRIGLLAMSRHHVHLSADIETARTVASRRKGKTAMFLVDAKRMLADGLKFQLSENGVWLVDAVPAKYLTQET
jgi:putative RNA 2'-phosphotransferase